jgi:hypothetical protein
VIVLEDFDEVDRLVWLLVDWLEVRLETLVSLIVMLDLLLVE